MLIEPSVMHERFTMSSQVPHSEIKPLYLNPHTYSVISVKTHGFDEKNVSTSQPFTENLELVSSKSSSYFVPSEVELTNITNEVCKNNNYL